MLMLRKILSVPQSFFQFYYLVNSTEFRLNHKSYLTRFIRNSGSVIAGCCFSRQSDEESLFPKSNHDATDNRTVCNSHSQTTILQHFRNFLTMKRSCDYHNDISPQPVIVNTEQLEVCRKKQKIDDLKDSNIIEITVHSVTDSTPPTNKNLDFSKTEIATPEIKKSESSVTKPWKQRPNYFVAVKISDAKIIKALSELQHHMLERDERLRKSMIQLTTLHITLMVMYIGDAETHSRALKTLGNIHQDHNDEMSKNPLKLEFKGLGHFQNRVLYAKLSADESYNRLSLLAESVKKHYSIASISSTDSRGSFTPHLTVAKIRDMGKKKQFPKKIDPLLYKDFNDQYFGTQEVESIQLLSMTDPKDEAGYYSGNEIYFSAFEPKVKRDYLNKVLQTEDKKKNVKEMINSLMKEKLK